MDETCSRSVIVNSELHGCNALSVNWRQIVKSVTHGSLHSVWRRRRAIRLGLSFRVRRPDEPPTDCTIPSTDERCRQH